MKEIWKDIEGYEGYYQISNLGRVKSLERYVNTRWETPRIEREKILKSCPDSYGYLTNILSKENVKRRYYLHQLIAKAFIPNPHNKPCVNHKDLDRLNNNIDNLEWCTKSENTKHGWENGAFDVEKARETLKYASLFIKGKPIRCIELNMDFKDAKEACRILGLKSPNFIRTVANPNNDAKSAYGYTWEFI